MDEKGIYSEHIHAAKRSYLLQLKQATDESKYLVITECKMSDGNKVELQNIIIHQEDMDEFTDGLIKMVIRCQ